MKKLLVQMYKKARDLNDQLILKSLRQNGPFESLLDIGCWDGELTMQYAKAAQAKRVHGIEMLQEKSDEATAKGIQCFAAQADKDTWPLENESIDCIVSNQLIEHLSNVDHFLSEASRVLKYGGTLITSTNNLSSWHNIIALLLGWAPFDLTNSSLRVRGLGNPFAIHKLEPAEKNSMIHKCIYTPHWLFEWQKLYHFETVSHFGAGLYPLPAMLGTIFKKHAAFMIVTTKKHTNHHGT